MASRQVLEDESSGSAPGTPKMVVSNPGTPRGAVTEADVRNTPPPSSTPGSRSMTPQLQQQPLPKPSSSASLEVMLGQVPRSQPDPAQQNLSKYVQLLNVIEDMGRDIRPTYAASRTSAERLKRGIVHARILVRECLLECERAARN